MRHVRPHRAPCARLLRLRGGGHGLDIGQADRRNARLVDGHRIGGGGIPRAEACGRGAYAVRPVPRRRFRRTPAARARAGVGGDTPAYGDGSEHAAGRRRKAGAEPVHPPHSEARERHPGGPAVPPGATTKWPDCSPRMASESPTASRRRRRFWPRHGRASRPPDRWLPDGTTGWIPTTSPAYGSCSRPR